MYYGSEYFQNIVLIFFKNNNNIINIKSRHVFLSWHVMKNLQSMTKKKTINFFLKRVT